jgi:alpha-1,6-mannosyltransferase
MYGYTSYGRMQVVYGLNPLIQPPHAMISDPALDWTFWRDIISVYGPVWMLVTRAIAWAAPAFGAGLVPYLLSFKLLNLGLVAISTGLVWTIGGQLGWGVARRAAAALIFAWCPLTIIELIGNGHNDALLIVCILAAIWLHLRGAWPLAIVALVLGGLVKLPGFFLLPAYGVLLLRTSGSPAEAARRTGVGLGLAALLVGATYLPYLDPALGHAALANPLAGFFNASPTDALRWAFSDLALALRGTLAPPTLTLRDALEIPRWPLWYGALVLWGALAAVFSYRVRDFAGLLRAWGLVLFSYLLIAALWFQPWYAAWLLPFIVLAPPGRLRRAMLLLAVGGTLSYAVSPGLPGDLTPDLRHYYVPAVVFLPPLLYGGWLGVQALARWRGRRVELPRPKTA